MCQDGNSGVWMVYSAPACGTFDAKWLTSECLSTTVVVSPYRQDRYYTQLIYPIGFPLSSSFIRCPDIDRCYDSASTTAGASGYEIFVDEAACDVTNYKHSLYTFEVDGPPDMSINSNKGPEYYYEGYSYLTDLNDGDIVLIRMISGAYLFDKTIDTTNDNIYGRCYVAYDNMKWKVDTVSGTNYNYFKNKQSGKFLCRDPTLIGGNSYKLIVSTSLSQDCHFESGYTSVYGDRGYTYLMLRIPSSGKKLCVDTDPLQADQCEETQNIVLKENCPAGDSGLVYFEKPVK